MQRVLSALAIMGALLALGACGGGSKTTTPAPQSGGNNNQKQGLNFQGPQKLLGSSQSTVVPDQLNVVTGASDAALQQTLDKFGYGLVKRDGDHATISVPDGNLDSALVSLRKEFTVISADKINVISIPSAKYVMPYKRLPQRTTSLMPLDPMYGDQFLAFSYDGTTTSLASFLGEGWPMNSMDFNGAWDSSTSANVTSIPVKIAVIDAGFFDYTVGRDEIDPTILDAVNSGHVDATGAFTPGFTAATWDINDDGDPTTVDVPYRATGDLIMGVLAATQNSIQIRAFDLNGDSTITSDEVWNEGIAGINPSAHYILIKTGTLSGGAWTFSDNEISKSIDHAVAAGANIIVLGMSGQAAIGASVQTSITAARNADCLVVAPAGDVVDSFNGTDFDNPVVDISATPVTPASAVGCVSVAATGYGRAPTLPDVTINGNPVPNVGNGWLPAINPAILNTPYTAVAPWANTGAEIAASGFGLGLGFRPFLENGAGTPADPAVPIEGVDYNLTLARFGSVYSAAYVAGAASIVYQGLAVANAGVFPADVDTKAENILLQTSEFAPVTGILNNNGFLNANKAMNQAISGGTLFEPALAFLGLAAANQPLAATTVNQDLSLTLSVVNGTPPYKLSVDWGDGAGPQITNNWVPGTVTTLAGGYGTLGHKKITITVTDGKNASVTEFLDVFVIDPLTATISITDDTGKAVAPGALKALKNYVFEVKAANVYTGTGDDPANPGHLVPNVTTFTWDFGNASPTKTGTAPSFAYTSPGSYTLKLTSDETLRPDQTFSIAVTVQ